MTQDEPCDCGGKYEKIKQDSNDPMSSLFDATYRCDKCGSMGYSVIVNVPYEVLVPAVAKALRAACRETEME